MRACVFGYEFCTPKGPLQKAFLSLKGSKMMLLQKALLFVAKSQAKPLHFVEAIFGLWTWFCSSKMGAPRIVAIKRLHRCTPAIWTRIYIVLYIIFYKIFYIILYIYKYICMHQKACCFMLFQWVCHMDLMTFSPWATPGDSRKGQTTGPLWCRWGFAFESLLEVTENLKKCGFINRLIAKVG